MIRKSILTSIFAMLLMSTVSAQSLPGGYTKDGSSKVALAIVPIPFTGAYVGVVTVDGEVIERETMVITPHGDKYKWKNNAGNEGEITQDGDSRELEVEVKTGPNKGKKSKWKPST